MKLSLGERGKCCFNFPISILIGDLILPKSNQLLPWAKLTSELPVLISTHKFSIPFSPPCFGEEEEQEHS